MEPFGKSHPPGFHRTPRGTSWITRFGHGRTP